jgi:hypothetical protein
VLVAGCLTLSVAPTASAAALTAYAGPTTGTYLSCVGPIAGFTCEDPLLTGSPWGTGTYLDLTVVLAGAASIGEYGCFTYGTATTMHCVPDVAPSSVGQLPPSFDVTLRTLSVSTSQVSLIVEDRGPDAGTWSVAATVANGPEAGDTFSCTGAAIGDWGHQFAPFGGSMFWEQDQLIGACTLG